MDTLKLTIIFRDKHKTVKTLTVQSLEAHAGGFLGLEFPSGGSEQISVENILSIRMSPHNGDQPQGMTDLDAYEAG